MNLLDTLASYARQTPFPAAGEYWARDNAEFEKTNPRVMDRVIRAINPMTMMGSAMGAMHDGANKGSKEEMLLAALQAWPALASLKGVAVAGQGLTKAGIRHSTNMGDLAAKLIGGTGASVAVDTAQANDQDWQTRGKR